MKQLFNVVAFTIHQGKECEFDDLIGQCVQIVRNKDTGTLRYSVFYNDDRSECALHEHFADSAAALEHLGNLGDTFSRLLDISDLSVEVYGTPSSCFLNAIKGLPVTVYNPAYAL